MATATFTTIVDRAVGDPITEAIWDDQIRDNGNALAGAHRNLLTNGGFEVWQRGAGAFTAFDAFSADRWQQQQTTTVQTVTKETSVVDGASVAALKNVVSGFSVQSNIYQKIEDFTQLKGKTVSFSCRVQQSVASMVQLSLEDGVASTAGSFSATTGSFVTLTATRTLSASATRLICYVLFIGNGTYYLDNAMLVVGPAPAPYQPLHPQEDLARCQRYYEVHGGVNPSMSVTGYSAASAFIGQTIGYATAKAATPTVTKNGTWAVTNCGQPAVNSPSVANYNIFALVTALGAASFAANSGDDSVTSEINP